MWPDETQIRKGIPIAMSGQPSRVAESDFISIRRYNLNEICLVQMIVFYFEMCETGNFV